RPARRLVFEQTDVLKPERVTGKDQRILLRAASKRDLAVVLDLDFVDAPVDKVKDRARVRSVLVFLFRNVIGLVRNFVRPDVASFSGFGEVAVKGRYRGRVAVVVNKKVRAIGA